MGTIIVADREEWVRNLCIELADRADTTPWMTAVRTGGESVTYGDLVDSLHGFRRVVDAQLMSTESALAAAVMHNLPGLARMAPVDLARSMKEIVDWLGREVPVSAPTLRAVV